jgi:hypothetical protein
MTIAAETTTTGQGSFGLHPKHARRRQPTQAVATLPSTERMPAKDNGSGDRVLADTQSNAVSATVLAIRELQAHRVATLRAQIRIDNACGAIAGRALGWRVDLPEKDRKRINDEAAALVEAIQEVCAVEASYRPIADAIRPFVIASLAARQPFDAYRKQLDKEMERLAESLPVWKWANGIVGFGRIGLAIIVGEAGDLSNYSNPAKLWKRLGLAVFNGKSQRKVSGDGAIEQGYNPRRRSAVWTVTDSLLRKPGPYKDLYNARKAYERERAPDMSKMHSHRRAQRYAGKRLVRDLWRAWRDSKGQA